MVPLIEHYKTEISNLAEQHNELALILVCGVLSELIAREIAGNERGGYEKLLIHLVRDKKITNKQYILFEEVRETRNRYVHISSSKVLESRGLGVIDDNGIVTFLEEAVYNDLTEENLSNLYLQHLAADSEKIYTATQLLIKICSETHS